MSVAYDPILERLERNVAAVIGLGAPAAQGLGSVGADRSGLASVSIAAAGFVAVLGGLSAGLVHLWPKLAAVEPAARVDAAFGSTPAPSPERDETFTPVLADLRPLQAEAAPAAGETHARELPEKRASEPRREPGIEPRRERAELAKAARPSAERSRPAAPGPDRPQAVQLAFVRKPATAPVALGPEVVVTPPIPVTAPAFATPPSAAPAAAMAMSAPPPEPAARVKRRDSVAALMTLRRQW